MKNLNLSWDDVAERADFIASEINIASEITNRPYYSTILLYGVPRGGIYAAQAIATAISTIGAPIRIVSTPGEADFIVDDIIDTGETEKRYIEEYTNQFYALVDYQGRDKSLKGTWISFPWERMINDDGPVENIRRLIEYIGDDIDREGLKETPDRVLKSYEKLFGGYKKEAVPEIIKTFKDDCDEMILLKDIEFYSTCEHHMLPFFGKAHIAYIPRGQVIGVSKLVRLLEIFTRRLQIQERICQQVTESLNKLLTPLGAACILEAQHFCMTARGVEKQHSIMVTSSLTGAFKNKSEARSELMSMIGK